MAPIQVLAPLISLEQEGRKLSLRKKGFNSTTLLRLSKNVITPRVGSKNALLFKRIQHASDT